MFKEWVLTTDYCDWKTHFNVANIPEWVEVLYSTEIPPGKVFCYQYCWNITDDYVFSDTWRSGSYDVPTWEKNPITPPMDGDTMVAHNELTTEFPGMDFMTSVWLLS